MPNICVATDTTGISMESMKSSALLSLHPRQPSIHDLEKEMGGIGRGRDGKRWWTLKSLPSGKLEFPTGSRWCDRNMAAIVDAKRLYLSASVLLIVSLQSSNDVTHSYFLLDKDKENIIQPYCSTVAAISINSSERNGKREADFNEKVALLFKDSTQTSFLWNTAQSFTSTNVAF